MLAKNYAFDARFIVAEKKPILGGMGEVYVVKDNRGIFADSLMLKCCNNIEYMGRFKREVKLMKKFCGNPKVAQIFHSNLEHNPPYFVMKYYKDGDLTKLGTSLSIVRQKDILNQMIDCIQELHSYDTYHRDIKPSNFLMDGDYIVVSDFGLSVNKNSSTRLTSTSVYGGTDKYIPPEYLTNEDGSFKNADPLGEMYMLGKSFYVILTGDSKQIHLNYNKNINPILARVIKKAYEHNKADRYKNLNTMKDEINNAFAILLNENNNIKTILDEFSNTNKSFYDTDKVFKFIDLFSMDKDKVDIIQDVNEQNIFYILVASIINQGDYSYLELFLDGYDEVNQREYYFGFAETIANHMEIIFNNINIPLKYKVYSLKIAIEAAKNNNRFAAMKTCNKMIQSVREDELANAVIALIEELQFDYLKNADILLCKNEKIKNYLKQIPK